MLKYKFKDKIIQISDNTAYWLDKGYPKEVTIEVEDFSSEGNKALAFKKDGSREVFIVLPCGRRPSIRYNDGCFEWNDFELIKKVDYEELKRKDE